MIYKLFQHAICLTGLITLSPVLLLLAILIFVEDGSPIIYKQARLGKDKKKFIIYKLRTMKNDAPQIATHEISKKHILKLGNFIRKSKFDEFPQLLNILKGDINFVGPRPGMESIDEIVQQRDLRNIYCIKPGITGLSQILGVDMSNPAKLAEIDQIYVKNRSVRLNLIIFAGTFFDSPKKFLIAKFNINV
jgi:O-antigen biosynthesis protein WbqP